MFVEVARMMNIDDAMEQLQKFKNDKTATTSPEVTQSQDENINIETEPTQTDESSGEPIPQ